MGTGSPSLYAETTADEYTNMNARQVRQRCRHDVGAGIMVDDDEDEMVRL